MVLASTSPWSQQNAELGLGATEENLGAEAAPAAQHRRAEAQPKARLGLIGNRRLCWRLPASLPPDSRTHILQKSFKVYPEQHQSLN